MRFLKKKKFNIFLPIQPKAIHLFKHFTFLSAYIESTFRNCLLGEYMRNAAFTDGTQLKISVNNSNNNADLYFSNAF